MKATIIVSITCLLILNQSWTQGTGIEDKIKEVFDGRTPCQELAKQLNETTIPECIKIKWRLTLYKESAESNNGEYTLEGFVFRKDRILKGSWRTMKGATSDPDAIVYSLERENQAILYLLKADENVLFFLDKGKNIMVGNRNFSYTLNRVSE